MIKEILRNIKTPDKSLVFVWGDFNILHPGHLRLLNFAADCGDVLVVGIRPDWEKSVVISAEIRLQSLQSISVVDYAFVLTGSPEEFIADIKPDFVVKGQEHKISDNPEKKIISSYGGELIFSSGETKFSSIDLLRKEGAELIFNSIYKPREYLDRHDINSVRLANIVRAYKNLSVVVIGDLIIDEYINCDPLGMSQEDPTIVVTPINRDMFVGGAGIVASHAKGLGAKVSFLSVCGADAAAEFAKNNLALYAVDSTLITDHSRPTTLKQRFRARGKTLLRVSELKQHEISDEIAEQLFSRIKELILNTSLIIFSDFNYGCLPQSLVDKIIEICKLNNIPMFADSQSSSQIGDITRFKHMKLVTPTEHEVRLALGDSVSGLVTLAEKLENKAQCEHSFITLGGEGAFVHSPNAPSHKIITDILPALNQMPRDVAGAGDSMLVTASMAIVCGANIWEAAYLGSVAAACQVGRVGNRPLLVNEIIKELS